MVVFRDIIDFFGYSPCGSINVDSIHLGRHVDLVQDVYARVYINSRGICTDFLDSLTIIIVDVQFCDETVLDIQDRDLCL